MPSPNANSLVRPRLPEVDTHGVHGPGLGADGRDWVGALSEVARVARHFVAMAEPFREWNADSLRRDRIVGKSYFQAPLTDLHAHGLELADIPAVPNATVSWQPSCDRSRTGEKLPVGSNPHDDTPVALADKDPLRTSPTFHQVNPDKGYRRSHIGPPPQPDKPAASLGDYCSAVLSCKTRSNNGPQKRLHSAVVAE